MKTTILSIQFSSIWYSIERWTMPFVSIGIYIPGAHTLTHYTHSLRKWSICWQSILLYVNLKTFNGLIVRHSCIENFKPLFHQWYEQEIFSDYDIIHHFTYFNHFAENSFVICFSNHIENFWTNSFFFPFKSQKRWNICNKIAFK